MKLSEMRGFKIKYACNTKYRTGKLVRASPLGRKQAHRAIHWPPVRGLAV